jgi:aerobic carbon-monoxide dehydrogenase large subunit
MPKDIETGGGIGASTKRREDVRFLTGNGRYTDDINLRGQAYAHFLRSEVAHGRIGAIDTAAAEAMPGVIRIFTARDFEGVGGLPCGWQVTDRHGAPMQEPKHPVLAEGTVRHVGDPIAVVVAETAEAARDAAEAIAVDIEELPAVIDMKAALQDGAPKVHDDLASNLCYDWGFVEENREAVPTPSPGPRMSRRWNWSTSVWSPIRWSRAWRWATTIRGTTPRRSTPPARTRT